MWSEGKVDDTSFKNGIQFLIQEKFIDVDVGPNVSVDKDELTPEELAELEEEKTIMIPDWIKFNVELWALGEISEEDFLVSIEYMLKNGFIEI